jgi:hypothetical protein
MTTQVNPRLITLLKSLTQAVDLAMVLIGELGLVAWSFDITALKGTLPRPTTMELNTASGKQ